MPSVFDNRADLILVPTETARQRAIRFHISPEKLQVVGLPVAVRYCQPIGKKSVLRKKQGWPLEKPVGLLGARHGPRDGPEEFEGGVVRVFGAA